MPDDTEQHPDDFLKRHRLQLTCRAEPGSDAAKALQQARVLTYAKGLPVDEPKLRNPHLFIAELREDIVTRTLPRVPSVSVMTFEGSTSRELNTLLSSLPADNVYREIRIRSPEVRMTEPISLRSRTTIRGNGATIFRADAVDMAFLGMNTEDAGLDGVVIEGPRICAVMLKSCRGAHLGRLSIHASQDYGIVVRGRSSYLLIESCRLLDNARAALMIEDGSHHVLVRGCEAAGGRHSSNWAAGIVISALRPVTEFGIRDAFEPCYFYPKDLRFKADAVPHHNLVENCLVRANQSSGIYVDGGNGNALTGNTIVDNDKEGVCLDFHATCNLVVGNVIRDNGFRRRQTDDDLRTDMVLGYGRMEDGSATAKVPNISLDNAAGNLLLENAISGGAGGGIKIVRSGFRNIFAMNTLADNNAGGNHVFTFPGILLGSAGAEAEIQNDTSGLDRTASFENLLVNNVICGNHAVGIVFDPHSTHNDTRGNLVVGQSGPPVVTLAVPNPTSDNSFDPMPLWALLARTQSLWRRAKALIHWP